MTDYQKLYHLLFNAITDALEVLDHAFKDQKLSGLKLNPSKQAFYPDDPMMDPIYKKCLEYNKPIMFHAGMSWEPDCRYSA